MYSDVYEEASVLRLSAKSNTILFLQQPPSYVRKITVFNGIDLTGGHDG